jgi:hypothetical protein
MTEQLVAVRFVAPEPPYAVGAVDAFPRATAERLIAKGSAERVDGMGNPLERTGVAPAAELEDLSGNGHHMAQDDPGKRPHRRK